jgi:hypothetical protein
MKSLDELIPEWRTYAKFEPLYQPLAVAAAGVFVAAYFLTALPRLFYPYDLDFVEDSMLMQALRFGQGQPVYVQPSVEFAPHVYMPLYPWLGGLIFRVAGPGFLPLRLLSFSATLITAALIYFIARRESGGERRVRGERNVRPYGIGFVCAALYLGGYRLSGFWYDLARVDSLYVALALAGVALGIYSKRSPGWLASAFVLALAFFTKQTGLAFAAGVAIYLFFIIRLQAALFVAAFAAFTLIPLFAFDALGEGWFFYHVFRIASGDPVEAGRLFRYLGPELIGGMGGLMVMGTAAAIIFLRRAGWRTIRERPWLVMILIAIVVSGVGRSSVGGNLNNLMPVYAFLCLAPALFWREWRPPSSAVVAIFVIAQFGLGIYNPLRYIPTAEMRQSGDRLIQKIAAIDGEVWVMMHPYYAVLAGKEPSAQMATLWYVHEWQGLPFPEDMAERIRARYYAAIISDETLFETDPDLQSLILDYYSPAERLDASFSPLAPVGFPVRPMIVYQPRQRRPTGSSPARRRSIGTSLPDCGRSDRCDPAAKCGNLSSPSAPSSSLLRRKSPCRSPTDPIPPLRSK